MSHDLETANELLDAEVKCFLQSDEQIMLIGGPDVHDKHLYLLGSLNRYVKNIKIIALAFYFAQIYIKTLVIIFQN